MIENGLYGEHRKRVQLINQWYSLYDGNQEWATAPLDYKPTKIINNYIKKIIDTRARFMFGKEPFFDVRDRNNQELADEKEDLLQEILKDNRFHYKLMKAYKDCLIAGNVGIKLWGHIDEGVKIVFVPAQEYFIDYNLDDVDKFDRVTLFHMLNDETDREQQRGRRQIMYMVDGRCYLDEEIVNGYGKVIETIYKEHDTMLDFIPFINITNGGLTGEVYGNSSVEMLQDLQDAYNKLMSDDVDALKFQMFGQYVFKNASEDTMKNLTIAPGAIIDLQKDLTAGDSEDVAADRLESSFSYGEQLDQSLTRIKNNMYDLLEIPNVSTSELKGLMASGKSMKALYWGLIAACDEDWAEWGDKLRMLVDYIFKLVATYNLYGKGQLAAADTTLEIEEYYPLSEDEIEQRRADMEEVRLEIRSRRSYMDKWGNYENIEMEMDNIKEEQQQLDLDNYTQMILEDDSELNLDV